MPRRPARYAALVLALGILPPAHADGLTRREKTIVSRVEANREVAIQLLGRVVDVPSATENLDGVRKVGALFADELKALGFRTRWVEMPPEIRKAGHLVAEREGTAGKRLLLIGHLDTVLQGEPFRRDGDRAYGSGASDMKGGDVVIVEALRALHQERALEGRRIIVVLTGDEEEPGHPHAVSRAALVEAAKRSDAALAFEGFETGVAVVGRRGIGAWHLEVTGQQGHSSAIFSEGRGDGAIFEAARILAAFHDELREPYFTYNPSVIVGGTDVTYDPGAFSGAATGKHNVVPRQVVVEGDMRFLTREQLGGAREKMRAIVARSLPRTSATISFTDGMPSMAPTDGNRALLKVLDGVSRDLGAGPIGEHDPLRRGAGDVSFVAGYVDCLDGLGAEGEKEHAPGEVVELPSLVTRAQHAALLIYRLTR